MTATLTVRMRNETREAIGEVVDDLDQAKVSADQLGQSLAGSAQRAGSEIERLSKQQSEEIRIIHEQRQSWSSLAGTAIPAIGSITVAGVKYAETLAIISARQKYLETLMSPLMTSHRAFNAVLNVGERAAFRGAATLAGYGTAAARLTTAVGIATGVVKGFEAVLALTGRTVEQGWDFSKATDEQKKQIDELRRQADELGIIWTELLDASGKKFEDLGGVRIKIVESNLTRVQEASSQLLDDIGALGDGAITVMKEWGSEVARLAVEHDPLLHTLSEAIPVALEKFEEYGDRLARNLTEGMNLAGEAIRGVSHEAVEASKSLEALQKSTEDDFARVRVADAQAEAAAKKRTEAARLSGLSTTQAIDSEIQKLRERRGIMAANNQFDADAQKRYLDSLESLERRRTQLLEQRQRQEADDRKKRIDAEKEQSLEITRLYSQALEDRNAKILKENAEYEKALDEEVKAIMRQHQEQQRLFQQLTQMKAREAQKQRDDYVARWKEAVGQVAAIVSGQGKGGDGQNQIEQLRNSLSQRDIARQVGEKRRAAAMDDFAAQAAEWRQRLADQGISAADADRRIEARRRQIGDRAFSRGFGDVIHGRASESEVANAQNSMIQAVVKNATASGELAPVVAQGLHLAAQQSIQATQLALQAKAIARQSVDALQAAQQRNRATNGSLK